MITLNTPHQSEIKASVAHVGPSLVTQHLREATTSTTCPPTHRSLTSPISTQLIAVELTKVFGYLAVMEEKAAECGTGTQRKTLMAPLSMEYSLRMNTHISVESLETINHVTSSKYQVLLSKTLLLSTELSTQSTT